MSKGGSRRSVFGMGPFVAAAAVLALTTAVSVAAPGDLDTSFDGDGTKTIDYTGSDRASDVLVQPDGKIVLAGEGNPNEDVAVTRLNQDGTPDTSFDGDGTVGIDFSGTDHGNAAALQADGKIVVAGYTFQGDADIAVMRLNANGSLDTSFDGDGKKTIEYGGSDVAEDVLVQPDGKIVVAGYGNSNADFAVTRLNPDGSPDASFDGDSVIGIDFGGPGGIDEGFAAALQADGKIVVVGSTLTIGVNNLNVAMLRLNANGSLDASFDGDGKKTIEYGGGDSASDVLVQPDGKIVLAGAGNAGGDFAVTRLNPDGSPDAGFDFDGTAGIDLGGTDDRGQAAALQANGKIVVAGFKGADVADDPAIVRLQPGGSLDTTFSSDGKQTLAFPGFAAAFGAALQANGRILIAGAAAADVLVARLAGDTAAAGGGGAGGGPTGGGGGGTTSVPRCAGERATIVGTAGRDRLIGTRRSDVIVSLGGNDSIKGGRGNDRICGGTGNDSIAGESGNDRMYGQSGKDNLAGGLGNDKLDGGLSDDRLSGQSGRDTLTGGSGKDRMNGGSGGDNCNGGPGKDRGDCEREKSI